MYWAVLARRKAGLVTRKETKGRTAYLLEQLRTNTSIETAEEFMSPVTRRTKKERGKSIGIVAEKGRDLKEY